MLSDAQGSVLTGQRLGVYQVHERIGAGGMGEVYRARDTRLGRDVAIKILPQVFTADPDRLARFEREARVLASLNHPNIGAIYGLEEDDGVQALVLELVDGETLAERIRRPEGLRLPASGSGRPSGLPIAEALGIATQIADALDAAHEKGIVHRDLKPANIKITPDGIVKVLDFGLAKATAGDGAGPDLTHSPTITMAGTREGVILGTVAYMSPEQARGKPVDKRTDVWAFGCVLYEMLTGRAPFSGETVSDTIAKILEREPDWAARPAGTPAAARKLLGRCLEKEPRQRLRDIGDARAELSALASDPNAGHASAVFRGLRTKPAALVAVIVMAVALAAGVVALRTRLTSSSAENAGGISSVAVLPLVNLSDRPENEYLADGLALDVMNSLAKHPGLRVVSRTSAFAFKGQNRDVREIARALNVNSIVEGTLRQTGTTLRVSVQLTDAANGFQLWSETFERDLTEMTAIETQISRSVVERLAPGFSSSANASVLQPLSANPQAYDLFLRGQYAMAQRSRDGLLAAETHFREAVRLDPDFGAAWAALAEAVIPLHEVHDVRDAEAAYALATDAARRALTVGIPAAEGHAALAHILLHQYRWRAAEEEVMLALKENPGSAISHEWLGWNMQALGRFPEAERAYRRAIELDPLSGSYHYGLAVCVLTLGRAEEALRLAERGVQLGAGIAIAPGVLANVQLGRPDAAQRMLDTAPADTPSHLLDALSIYVAAAAGKRTEGRQLMADLLKTLPEGNEPAPMMVPFAFAALGESRAAIEWVRKSPNAGEFLTEYRLLPEMRALAGDAAMREMLRKFDFAEP